MPPPSSVSPTYIPTTLPRYLSTLHTSLSSSSGDQPDPNTITLLTVPQIRALPDRAWQYFHLLLRRHHLTLRLRDRSSDGEGEGDGGNAEPALLQPRTLLQRACVHEALAYPELAVADAYVAFTVGEYEVDGEGDLRGKWGVEEDDQDEREKVMSSVMRRAVAILRRGLKVLGCEEEVRARWEGVAKGLEGVKNDGKGEEGDDDEDKDGDGWCMFRHDEVESWDDAFHYGLSRREVYPWNVYEGDRMSAPALREINQRLLDASEGQLVVRKTILPDVSSKAASLEDQTANLDVNASSVKSENAQLGLFTTRDLPPNTIILHERSVLTAIRPHGEALCDACAGDLSDVPSEARQICPGCGIPFCSLECLDIAMKTYHAPNTTDDETDEGFPPAATPFCPGSTGEADIANLGRAEGSDTPEWDLYFLLVTRALQMAETLDCHPLEIWECKYLWGSFEAAVSPEALAGGVKLKRSLPFSMRHHVELPLQWFELLLLSRAESAPYARKWMDRYDWWVIQTLYAKFRGVADARLSSWTGEPETAGVFPLWCLANHSCDAGVTWEGGGVRRLKVRGERVVPKEGEDTDKWKGLKAGEEVWNHYTDVRERDYRVRRDRLRELLGGDCRCTRCVSEETEDGER